MPGFQIAVVGCGGGPDETNLSSYLFKPYEALWEDGVIGLEAGSGQGALTAILERSPELFKSSIDGVYHSAAQIFSFIRGFLVSHAHLDHVMSLVLSAGSSTQGPRRRVFAARQTLLDLENVFSDRLWPNLASWKEEDESFKLLYTALNVSGKYRNIFPDVAVRMMPVSHGSNACGNYESAAFFIKRESTSLEFLFFGDLEPDSIAAKPQTIDVWHAAASKFPANLSSIFIECSWRSDRPEGLLFGHLSPKHLLAELQVFASEVVRARSGTTRQTRSGSKPPRKRSKANSISEHGLVDALRGLRLYIIHCKDNQQRGVDRPIHELIADEVRALVDPQRLGVEIIAVSQGMLIAFESLCPVSIR